jgi:hypothetical protein
MILQRRVSKFDCVTKLTSVETSRREPWFLVQSCAKNQTCNVSVARDVTILIVILVVDVLIVVVKDSVRSAAQLIKEVNCAVYDLTSGRNTDNVAALR